MNLNYTQYLSGGRGFPDTYETHAINSKNVPYSFTENYHRIILGVSSKNNFNKQTCTSSFELLGNYLTTIPSYELMMLTPLALTTLLLDGPWPPIVEL